MKERYVVDTNVLIAASAGIKRDLTFVNWRWMTTEGSRTGLISFLVTLWEKRRNRLA